MSLLEKAQKKTIKKKEEEEVVLAWLAGTISYTQASIALCKKKSMAVYVKAFNITRQLIAEDRIKIIK